MVPDASFFGCASAGPDSLAMTPRSTYICWIDRFSRTGSLLVFAVGMTVFFGWLFDLPALKSVSLSLATMKVNTACAFMAAGMALWLKHAKSDASRSLAQALAIGVAALGGLTVAQDLSGMELGIDQFLLSDDLQSNPPLHPGRMSPATAICFLFAGLAIAAIKPRHSLARFVRSDWLVLIPLFISSVAIVGYAYDVSSLYRVGAFSSMALHTALAIMLLCCAIFASDSESGIAQIVVSDTAGGTVARRLLPTVPVVLFGLGWTRLVGEKSGFYDANVGLALMVVLSMAVSVVVIASTAVTLHKVDQRRKTAEAEVIAINAGLERRVQERTRELEATLGQVKRLDGLLPICAWCKKVRDDQDYWHSVETYVAQRSDATFSHGICPDCMTKAMAADNGTAAV